MRKLRKKSYLNVYHIMMRGINKQQIFFDSHDYDMFIVSLKNTINTYDLNVLGCVLMGNHVHLIINAPLEVISHSIKSLGASFVRKYNNKYERVGALFQSNFCSDSIDSYSKIRRVLKYIHLNPVKAKIVNTAFEYHYSSIHSYSKSSKQAFDFINTDFLQNYFDVQTITSDAENSNSRFKFSDILDIDTTNKLNDKALINKLYLSFGITNAYEFQNLEFFNQIKCIRELLISGHFVSQISRLTGIPKKFIKNIKMKIQQIKTNLQSEYTPEQYSQCQLVF